MKETSKLTNRQLLASSKLLLDLGKTIFAFWTAGSGLLAVTIMDVPAIVTSVVGGLTVSLLFFKIGLEILEEVKT